MGPSGAGKSSILHILGMHDTSWTGEYWSNGSPGVPFNQVFAGPGRVVHPQDVEER